jgi:hypothetical protein
MKGARTPYQRESDLVDIARLLLKGSEGGSVSTLEIKEWIGRNRPYTLSLDTIRKDIREIMERWKASQLRDTGTLKARELAMIEMIQSEAWKAWYLSGGVKTEVIEKTIRDRGTNDWSRDENLKKQVERDPDPKYMRIIMWCSEQRSKILDLYPAQKIEVDWREEARAMGLDDAAIFNNMVGAAIENMGSDRGEDDAG